MKVLVVGCGNIGSVAAEDLAKSRKSVDVVVADYDKTRAEAVARKIGTDNVSAMQLDVTKPDVLQRTLKGSDIVMGFLPGDLGFRLMEACIDACVNLVDVSFGAEDPLRLDEKAVKAGVTVIPDCGLAPGISNLLVGHAVAQLEEVESVHIMVGGLPEKPVPPLGYVITWSPESLIDEYTRKARIVQRGRQVSVDALTGLEVVDFPGVGELEAFLTDGLRTLISTVEAGDMWEKTLRFPGHADRIRAFEQLGFFDEKEVDVGSVKVSPRKLTVKLLGQKLGTSDAHDIVVLSVEVAGVKDRKGVCHAYRLLDFYDRKHDVTAMARTTAYPASIVAQLMLDDTIKDKGVVPPEEIGMHDELFSKIMTELEKRDVTIETGKAAKKA
ncbi:MAG TPA: saccharopine dehydrogenase family protein [Candidatus Acidoferrum sp.]|jgi:saccharopine dehydrogenase-like NADP-dependent oxidoreductase|nr:saccharopine dehydrogenase family protein [Candidatus Acidoferrum sp.]